MRRRVPDRKSVSFALFLAILGVITAELGLSVASVLSPRVRYLLSSPWDPKALSPTIPDSSLVYRPNPAYQDHDRKGFRNPRVPPRADVVALGDSQTYGTGVQASEAWPRQLERMSDLSVYSMAFGGYGPVHSLLLWDEAMALRPAVVIEAFYAGNDLYDAFQLVYGRSQRPELKSRDRELVAAVLAAEGADPLTERISRTFHMGTAAPADPGADPALAGSGQGEGLRSRIAGHSRVYGLLRRVRHEISRWHRARSRDEEEAWRKARAFAERNAEYCELFADETTRTVFTPEYRLCALDLDDPRIREGHLISLRAIDRMRRLADDRDIRFLALLIPTKELVFAGRRRDPRASYLELVRKERRFWERTKAWLDERDIEYVDLLGPLQRQLETGPQPYQVTSDGHPNALGHRVIAESVRARLDAASGP